eukprot:Skav224082  [mRNA]  locus=scaffold942:224151:230115:+ [translate_table: standard]
MPGRWVGGRGSQACPTKDQFIEGRTVGDYGEPQGTVLVRVKRLYSPGEKGRFILGDYVAASEKAYREWASSKAGKLAAIDGSYHLCRAGAEHCQAGGTHDVVVHIGQWRTWKEEELMAGGPDEYPREARNLVQQFFKKHDLLKGKGEEEDIPWKPARQGVLNIGRGTPPPKARAKSPVDDKEEEAGKSKAETAKKREEMSRLKEQLKALKAEVQEAEGGKKSEKKKKGSTAGKSARKKPRVSFDKGGIHQVEGSCEADYGGDDDDEPPDDDSDGGSSEESSDEESAGSKDREKAKNKRKKVAKKDKARSKKKKKGKSKKGKKKGSKLERDKGPFGVGETRVLPRAESDQESEEDSSTVSSERSFRKAPSGLTLHLRLLRYAQRYPGRLATRLLQKMERATRFEGAIETQTGTRNGRVKPCAVTYLLTILAPSLREKWNVRSQREMRVLSEILDQLAAGRGSTAADIVAQRLKALEQSVQDGNGWRKAKYLELVAEETSMTDRGEEQMMQKEVELEEKFRHRGANQYWRDEAPKGKDGKGTGKQKGRGKGKAKTPAQEAAEKTLSSYKQAIRRFFEWLEDENFDIPSKPSILDERVASFLEHLWLDDINITYAGHTLSALRRFHPQLRYKLPVSRQFFSNWKSVHVTKQAVPLPGDVAVALAGVALAADEWALAASILLGFAAFLRTGEIAGLKTSEIDVSPQTGDIVLALPATKTSRNRMESVAVRDVKLATLLSVTLRTVPGGSLSQLSPSGFRARLRLLLAHLNLQDHGFSAYSIRRGGATHAFANGHHFDSLLVKGRWQSVKTARQYLDSGRAALVQLQFSDEAHHLIQHYQQFASSFCERLRQKRTFRC